MKKHFFLLPFFVLLLALSCQKDETALPAAENLVVEDNHYFTPDLGEITTRSSCPWTVIPAGSNNALAAAIANTCDDGVIYLKAGIHTETEPLTITKSVKIIGEAGAVLKVKSDLAPGDPVTGNVNIHPGLHVLNAPGTLIQDVEIQPLGSDGGTAILFEKSDQSAVMRCTIPNFQFAIVVERSDRLTIMFNKIVATSAWQTGAVGDAESITLINGKSCYISDNDISNALFGIWACGSWSTSERNNTHDCYIGFILCNVPPYLVLPSGEVTGSDVPGTGWKVRNNKSTNNFNIGYLVIDGAKQNVLENNEASGNAVYDMELTADTFRFGFLTPKSSNNTVNSTAFPNVTIKNCGDNNSVTGGTLVDNSADPCN